MECLNRIDEFVSTILSSTQSFVDYESAVQMLQCYKNVTKL